ncbi:MAG: hypothetical protein ACK4GN_09200 [Runella sp.]
MKLVFSTGDTLNRRVLLPVCDPIIPLSPLVASQTLCKGEPTPTLVAFTSQPEAVVDWYDKPVGGQLLSKNSFTFLPNQAGVFYAESRIQSTGCVSLSRTLAVFSIKNTLCIPVMTRVVKSGE